MVRKDTSIVYLPGAWHGPDTFDEVAAQLGKRGYEVHCLHLPTAGLDPKSTPVDDVALIQKTSRALADQGKYVTLVMHSYGGFVGSESVRGLSKKDRLAQGKPGGIINLVYIAAFPGVEGELLVDPIPDWVTVEGEWARVPNAREVFYSDFPTPKADELVAKLLPHAASVYEHRLAYAGYEDVPATYLLCTQDKVVPLEVQKAMAALGGEIMRTEACDSGHFCMLSDPGIVTEAIIRAEKASNALGNWEP
ncbi:hypothetical protein AJ79_03838 [Helicocarpus griseus UAMH5409]|uniref:AB hydrolase-1 domain-containing protein n=1 Tax=Helicocarpus griseus UAMH5409 TaxID=1447875 RepID=A0A2B7XWI3_9EURO|nr:hypothetical protein AJ79_03838 [Helicocarpus griseus UAMH5409]